MKKVVLILSLLVISSFVKAQEPSVIETYKSRMGLYNSHTKEYDFQDYSYANLTFKVYGTYITVNDKQNSVYRSIEKLPNISTKDYESATVACLDEKNRKCNFGIMKFSSGEMRVIILYPQSFILVYNVN